MVTFEFTQYAPQNQNDEPGREEIIHLRLQHQKAQSQLFQTLGNSQTPITSVDQQQLGKYENFDKSLHSLLPP
jgi:hypothetical protein